ncbi:hydrolase [Mycobacterium phage Pharaoh]|uniref:Hydrolase n=1 Tax=Mycobacterium phage Pharaoh TaxID=2530140 RepID=A0A481W1T5_9CAUD|nr:DNA binding protein [Mycobacterium phage Pharaoh]QBJ00263.1 hydrolase [Mycobacterium phage Pharaoh]
MKTYLLFAAAAAGAAAILLAPNASADEGGTDAVYIGGTGTGYNLPVLGTGGDGASFAHTFVPNLDQLTNLDYDGSPVANPQASVPGALAAVKATDGPTVVIGLSKGAQVAHGVEAQDTRTDTRYVVVGDPDSDHGISRAFGLSPRQTVKTHDWDEVVAEYDGVGDMPDRPNALAFANAIAGWAFVHPNYGEGGVDDPLTHLGDATVTSSKNPNGTTYTKHLIPTAHLPLLKPLRDTELTLTHQSRISDALEAAIKPQIDKGYSRNDTKGGNKVEPSTKASDTSKPKSDNDTKTEPAKADTDKE